MGWTPKSATTTVPRRVWFVAKFWRHGQLLVQGVGGGVRDMSGEVGTRRNAEAYISRERVYFVKG